MNREQEAHDLALRACRQQGCTCEVEITIEIVDGLDASAAAVHHEDH
jgi:invasion protein IalB